MPPKGAPRSSRKRTRSNDDIPDETGSKRTRKASASKRAKKPDEGSMNTITSMFTAEKKKSTPSFDDDPMDVDTEADTKTEFDKQKQQNASDEMEDDIDALLNYETTAVKSKTTRGKKQSHDPYSLESLVKEIREEKAKRQTEMEEDTNLELRLKEHEKKVDEVLAESALMEKTLANMSSKIETELATPQWFPLLQSTSLTVGCCPPPPTPCESWGERLARFYKYDPTLISALKLGSLHRYFAENDMPAPLFEWFLSLAWQYQGDDIDDTFSDEEDYSEQYEVCHKAMTLIQLVGERQPLLAQSWDLNWFVKHFESMGLSLKAGIDMIAKNKFAAWVEEVEIAPRTPFPRSKAEYCLQRLICLLEVFLRQFAHINVPHIDDVYHIIRWLYRLPLDPRLPVATECAAALREAIIHLCTFRKISYTDMARRIFYDLVQKDGIYSAGSSPSLAEVVLAVVKKTPSAPACCCQFAAEFALEWATNLLLVKIKPDTPLVKKLLMLATQLLKTYRAQKPQKQIDHTFFYSVVELLLLAFEIAKDEISAKSGMLRQFCTQLQYLCDEIPSNPRALSVATVKSFIGQRANLLEILINTFSRSREQQTLDQFFTMPT